MKKILLCSGQAWKAKGDNLNDRALPSLGRKGEKMRLKTKYAVYEIWI